MMYFISAAVNQAIWLNKVLSDLGFASAMPVEIHCDSQAAIAISKNQCFMERQNISRSNTTLSEKHKRKAV